MITWKEQVNEIQYNHLKLLFNQIEKKSEEMIKNIGLKFLEDTSKHATKSNLMRRVILILLIFCSTSFAQQTISYHQSVPPPVTSYILTVGASSGTWVWFWTPTQAVPINQSGDWTYTLPSTIQINPGESYYLQAKNDNPQASDISNIKVWPSPTVIVTATVVPTTTIGPTAAPTPPRPTPPVLIQITGLAQVIVNGTPIP